MEELKNIRGILSVKYKSFYNLVKRVRVKNNKDFNVEGAFISHLLQFFENKIICAIFDFIRIDLNFGSHMWVSVICFDGILLPKKLWNESYIEKIENYLLNILKCPLKLKVKPLNPIDLEKFGYDKNVKYELYDQTKSFGEIGREIMIEDDDEYFDEKNLLFKTYFNDVDIAQYFVKKYNNFSLYKNRFYVYNGHYWIMRDDVKHSEIYDILSKDIYKKLYKVITGINIVSKYTEYLLRKINFLHKTGCLSGVFTAIKSEFNIYDDVFDKNENLVCFTNGTYDLETNIFRESKKEDYITKCIDYDFAILSDDDHRMIKCYDFLKKIMPEDDKRELLITCLATSLRSITLEKFIILTGNGRNGKDTLMTYLMKNTLCENGFYYETNANIITNDSKSELNVALNNCHKKNLIVINEPASNKKIICNQVKHITGGSNINARGLYSSVTETKINCSLFMLCNDMPLLDNPDDAMMMRLLVFKFNTTFKSKEELEDMEIYKEGLHEDGLYYFYIDEYYKSKEFVNECKLAMMNILIKHYNFYRLNKYIIKNNVKSVLEENKKYITNSCDFMSWFNSTYKFTVNPDDYVKLGDIYTKYKNSYLYVNLNKADKRRFNKRWLFDKIQFSPFLKKYYYDRNKFGKDSVRYVLRYCVEDDDNDDDFDEMLSPVV